MEMRTSRLSTLINRPTIAPRRAVDLPIDRTMRRITVDHERKRIRVRELDPYKLSSNLACRAARSIDAMVVAGEEKTLVGLHRRLAALQVTLVPRFKDGADEPYGLALLTDVGALNASQISEHLTWGKLKAAGFSVGDVDQMTALAAQVAPKLVAAQIPAEDKGDGWRFSPKKADLASNDQALQQALQGRFLSSWRPEERGDPNAGERHFVLVLQGIDNDGNPKRQSKHYTARADGNWDLKPFDDAFLFRAERVSWNGSFDGFLAAHKGRCAVGGDVLDPRTKVCPRGYKFSLTTPKEAPLRQENPQHQWRINRALGGNPVAMKLAEQGYAVVPERASIPDIIPTQKTWFLADLDHLPLPEGITDGLADPEKTVKAFVAETVPEFADARVVYQWSSSAGFKDLGSGLGRHFTGHGHDLSLHLFFTTLEPVDPEAMGEWLRQRSEGAIDVCTMMSPNQVHYIADPTFADAAGNPLPDPLGDRRCGIIDGQRDIPMPDLSIGKSQPKAKQPSTQAPTTPLRMPIGHAGPRPTSADEVLDRQLARMGRGVGQEGFRDVILRASQEYFFQLYREDRWRPVDFDAPENLAATDILFDRLRQTIEARSDQETDLSKIERYKSDAFLLPIARGAISRAAAEYGAPGMADLELGLAQPSSDAKATVIESYLRGCKAAGNLGQLVDRDGNAVLRLQRAVGAAMTVNGRVIHSHDGAWSWSTPVSSRHREIVIYSDTADALQAAEGANHQVRRVAAAGGADTPTTLIEMLRFFASQRDGFQLTPPPRTILLATDDPNVIAAAEIVAAEHKNITIARRNKMNDSAATSVEKSALRSRFALPTK